MLIQKVFHVRQSIDNARERLSDRRYFSDKFGGVFRCSHQLELLPTDDSDQVLFHSTGGEMELCGMMELLPIRDRLTEVHLTIEYEIQTPLRRTLDQMLGVMNRRSNEIIMEMKREMDDAEDSGTRERLARGQFAAAPFSNLAAAPSAAR